MEVTGTMQRYIKASFLFCFLDTKKKTLDSYKYYYNTKIRILIQTVQEKV